MECSRRSFLSSSLLVVAASGASASGASAFSQAPRYPSVGSLASQAPIRTITTGPKFHWFAYYDKLQFDSQVRYCLGNAVDFEHRAPTGRDAIEVGMVDLQDNDRWIPLGSSTAWGWQQGCMLQWIPNSPRQVIFNDRSGDDYISRVLDIETGESREHPLAIYSLSPVGRYAVTTDFRRINDLRPGYGYSGITDPWADQRHPREIGIQRLDLETGQIKVLISLAEIVDQPFPGGFGNGKHWFNHLLISPDGKRTIFLHRWQIGDHRWATRLFTIGLDGQDLRELNPGAGMISHFIWRDSRHILAWTRHASAGDGFYLIEDADNGSLEIIGKDVMTRDGHCTYLPGNQWIVNDTYPMGEERLQEVYLYHVQSGRRISLGRFHSPADYRGSWRCDTHPRHSPDGRYLCIDSPHSGAGRQMHLLDISEIVGMGDE